MKPRFACFPNGNRYRHLVGARGLQPASGAISSIITCRPDMRPVRSSLGDIFAPGLVTIGVQGCRHLVRVAAHA